MAIRKIDQVKCSLNLGLIYNLDYSYNPQSGTTITIFFVNESGEYQAPSLLPMNKVSITIGNTSFSMYAKRYKISKSSGMRVIEVEFVDEFFQLDNYYITLDGKGCGDRVYTLGKNVDNRSLENKVNSSLDKTAQRIKDFTQFPDLEYSFEEFLNTLRKKFSVKITAQFDGSLTNSFTGSFLEVLGAWCNFYNISFFFENGIIKIFDPTNLTINFPTQPIDALEYEVEEDISDTYSKTVCNWFQQEGGQFNLNQTSDKDGTLLYRTNVLYPIGAEFNLPQVNIDLNQVVAALYGEHFWFLYNYYKGTTSEECGWTTQTNVSNTSIYRSVLALSANNSALARIAKFDQNVYTNKFEAYKEYGLNIAGKYYMSSELSDLSIDKTYQWFDESQGGIFDFENADSKAMSLEFITPTNAGTNVISSTVLNQYYPGINFIGNRIVYKNNEKTDLSLFTLNTTITNLVEELYQKIFSIKNSDSMDFSELGEGKFLGYIAIPVPQDLTNIFKTLNEKFVYLQAKYTSIPIKGITQEDYSSLKARQNDSGTIKIVNNTQGPSVIANTSVIKTLKDGSYTIYYDKYSKCSSSSSAQNYFKHHFVPKQISSDIGITFGFNKLSNNSYKLTRDYTALNSLINNPYLNQLCLPRTFPTKRISFTLNYFYNLPSNFLSNGLVDMNIRVGDNGILCSYVFSNEILAVPDYEYRFSKYEQETRNSWVRKYYPKEVIS